MREDSEIERLSSKIYNTLQKSIKSRQDFKHTILTIREANLIYQEGIKGTLFAMFGDKLSLEMIFRISDYLDFDDLFNVVRVCKPIKEINGLVYEKQAKLLFKLSAARDVLAEKYVAKPKLYKPVVEEFLRLGRVAPSNERSKLVLKVAKREKIDDIRNLCKLGLYLKEHDLDEFHSNNSEINQLLGTVKWSYFNSSVSAELFLNKATILPFAVCYLSSMISLTLFSGNDKDIGFLFISSIGAFFMTNLIATSLYHLNSRKNYFGTREVIAELYIIATLASISTSLSSFDATDEKRDAFFCLHNIFSVMMMLAKSIGMNESCRHQRQANFINVWMYLPVLAAGWVLGCLFDSIVFGYTALAVVPTLAPIVIGAIMLTTTNSFTKGEEFDKIGNYMLGSAALCSLISGLSGKYSFSSIPFFQETLLTCCYLAPIKNLIESNLDKIKSNIINWQKENQEIPSWQKRIESIREKSLADSHHVGMIAQ